MTVDVAVDRTLDQPEAELERCAAELEGRPAADVLRWAVERYAHRLTFATGFGPEGCVLIDLIGRDRLPIDLFTLDTGLFFEETHALWRGLERRYGLKIRRVTPAMPLDAQAQAHGDRLWQRAPDHCCAIRKVGPLEGCVLIRRRNVPGRRSSNGTRSSQSRRSTRWSVGRSRTSGATSSNTTCRTIRCMISGTRASAVARARARCCRERTTARAGGGAAPRRNADCTAARRCRAEGMVPRCTSIPPS